MKQFVRENCHQWVGVPVVGDLRCGGDAYRWFSDLESGTRQSGGFFKR